MIRCPGIVIVISKKRAPSRRRRSVRLTRINQRRSGTWIRSWHAGKLGCIVLKWEWAENTAIDFLFGEFYRMERETMISRTKKGRGSKEGPQCFLLVFLKIMKLWECLQVERAVKTHAEVCAYSIWFLVHTLLLDP